MADKKESEALSNSGSSRDYGTTSQLIPKRGRSWAVIKPKRTVIVEPVMAAMFFVIVGTFPLVEQYIYGRLSLDYPILANGTANQSISEVCEAINFTYNDVYIATQHVQSNTAEYMMLLSIATSLPSLLTTIALGGYADALYRKPSLVLPTFGIFCRLTLVTAVVLFELPIYLLLLAAFVQGICGGQGALMSACFAYMADIVQPKSLAFRLVIMDVAFNFSAAAAGTLIGFMIGKYGFVVPCVVILCVALLNLLYVSLLVPETHSPIPDAHFSMKKFVTATYKVFTKPGPRRCQLWLILFVVVLVQVPIASLQSVSTLYQLNHPFCWGPALIGIYLTTTLLIIQAGSLFGSVVFQRCLKMKNISVVLIGDVSGVVAYVYYSLCQTTWQIFLVPVLGIFKLLPMPMSRAIASNLVDVTEKGALFAGLSVLYTIATVGGSFTFNTIYSVTLGWFNGTVFIICAALYLISFFLAGCFIAREKKTEYISLAQTSNGKPGDI